MNKLQLFALERNAHLTIAELRKTQLQLSEPIDERLVKRIQRIAVSRLAGGSKKLQKVAESMKLPLGALETVKVREATLKALREAIEKDPELAKDEELKKELAELEKAAALPDAKKDPTLAETLQLDLPIAFNPEFKHDLDAARLFRLSDAAGLGDKIATALIEKLGSVEDVTDDGLAELVKDEHLSAEEAKAAGFSTSLYHLLDEQPEMVATIKPGIKDVRDLVKYDKAAWVKVIGDSKTKPPGDISVDDYADLLARKVEKLFPTDALANRLSQVKPGPVLEANAGLAELRKLNPKVAVVGARDFSSLETKGISPAALKQIQQHYASALQLANRYPGLRLAAVFDDAKLTDSEKAKEVTRRIDLANRFFAENIDVLHADLTLDSVEVKKLKFASGASNADKAMVLATARSYQRVLTVTDDLAHAEALVVGGYPSAFSVATARPEALVAKTGLPAEIIARYQRAARLISTGVTAHTGTVIDILRGGFAGTAVGNLSLAIPSFLKEIPGFADFFGNQDFCNCKHCQSILSPAAYFVDLMCFVDENITQAFFATKPNHPLKLENRRPDLWTLELTCENTNKPIPYLVIINEILENAVAKHAGYTGNFGDRVAVGIKVYKDTLPNQVDSFKQPLHLPFEEIRTYLKHFARSLADIAEAGNATDDVLARLRLGLAPKDYDLITQANANLPFLRRIYGIQFMESGGTVQKFDAQLLLKPMGINRVELDDLIATRFITADGAVSIHINGERRSAESIQNDIERIQGLTRVALDRMHRFVRLWRATGWRIGELDLVLTHFKRSGFAADINPVSARALARIHRLQSIHNVSVEELVAFWSMLPQQAIIRSTPASTSSSDEDGSTIYPTSGSPLARFTISLLDRLFNQARFVETGGTYPQTSTLFLHPALATVAPTTVDPNLHRLQAGTGTDDDELLQLIVGLARPLGIDPSSVNDNRKRFPLNHRNLSLLYRHAELARLLKVSIPELFALAALASEVGLTHVDELAEIEALLRLHRWWKTTKWSIVDLVEIVRPGLAPIATSTAPVASTAGGETVTYTATVFGAVLPAETVSLAANADLAAVVTDWNGKAQRTVAYRSDSFGVPNVGGTHLSIRSKSGMGPDSKLDVTADSASIFTAALPLALVGSEVLPSLPRSESRSADELALELVEQVSESNSLVFADTVFTLLAPTTAVAVSNAPVPSTAGGEAVTYVPTLSGRVEAAETVTFAANATIAAAVTDWNSKARFTRAYRSDAGGIESASGTHLAVAIKEATGSNTQLTLTADSAGIFAATLPRDYKGAEITEAQSRELIAANVAALDIVDSDGHYRLKAGFDPNAALVLPTSVTPALAPALRDILRAFHSRAILVALLPSRARFAPEVAARFVSMLGVNLDDNNYFLELRGDVAPPSRIAALISRLKRLSLLFAQQAVFDAGRLLFIETQAALFGITNFDRVSISSVRRIELYRALNDSWLTRPEGPPDFNAILLAFDPVARYGGANQDALAAVLGCDVGLAQSLQSQLSLSATAFEVIQELQTAVALAQHIGIGGGAIRLVQSLNYDDLATASAALQAAIRAQYDDEAEWDTRVQPLRDALLSRRRDGLVAYLVHSGAPEFDEVSDLYHYFLVDVELEGCARTSRVAAAIDSVQLYVQRCQMNLEETPPGDSNPVHVLPESIPDEEWAWRKNYRVWEANRKIFLYPENYLQPSTRDDKTPLFKTLEEELLSKEITNEAILEAYSRYLRGYDELAHLTIAGSCHEKDADAKHDVLHLLGVTADDPPLYYYRRVEDAHYGEVSDERATHWGAWEKLNIQVPVRKAAPVIHNGQLYVFWIRYTTKSVNKLKNGDSKFTGYQHRAFVEFSRRKLDGSWTTPQRLRLDESPFGADSYPQSMQDDGVVLDPIFPKDKAVVVQDTGFGTTMEFTYYRNAQPIYDSRSHAVPRDEYTLAGFQWDQLYPGSGSELYLRGVNFQMWSPVDFYRLKIGPCIIDYGDPDHYGVPFIRPNFFSSFGIGTAETRELTALLPRRLLWSKEVSGQRVVHSTPSGPPKDLPCFDTYTYASLLIDEARFKRYEQPLAAVPSGPAELIHPQWDEFVTDYLTARLHPNAIGKVPGTASLDVVNGSVGDVVLQTSTDAFYLQHEVRADGKYHLRRLNTSMSEDIADVLFNGGLDELLSTDRQLGLQEHPTGLNLVPSRVYDASQTGTVDFNGAMGTYLREVYFHIPFLIADHLNSQGRYEDAQRWYHYIFDPTAADTITGLPAGLSPEERRRRELDRNWRYREFRGLTLESLRTQLTNKTAIEQYKRNPFNPHAIARLRIGAYQKAIVMKYVDNLLDWGDDLFAKAFAQLNPEYLREATLKYVAAQEILGDRPAELGDCGEGKVTPKNFLNIKDALSDGSEFLMELESYVAAGYRHARAALKKDTLVPIDADRGTNATFEVYGTAKRAGRLATASGSGLRRASTSGGVSGSSAAADLTAAAARLTVADIALLAKSKLATRVTAETLYRDVLTIEEPWLPSWGASFVREVSPIFCVPGNDQMLGYWDRVADRLYKLRHCMDIEGVVRQLPLFAPPIDPGLLVGGKAAGLSLEDILSATGGSLPPYRFRYLVEKAKGFAATVQAFGAALLSALEKRDAEELAKLRNVHQKNILALTTELRRNELKVAEESLEIATRRQAAAQYRKDYYKGLISAGLSGYELIQTAAQSIVIGVKTTQLLLATASGLSFLLPQVGSPFAMTYGGEEVGESLRGFSGAVGFIGQLAELTATAAGMAGGFERREQGWDHQMKLAEHDLRTIGKELAVAELRKTIASRSLELHEKAKEQHDEVMEYFGDKFSNLGLYTHLSRSLQQLHREAYNNALGLARMAEQAYRFERPGDNAVFVGGEWDASRSGLLAGERLLMGLHNMDKRFIETNARPCEINQSFSLAQIDPKALIDFKEIGQCEFDIPELYFDLFYPGQYRRRIRAVRLTIPCITGPYTNVSAKLTLVKSHIRKEATTGTAGLFEVPPGRTSSVATSTAQGDAGVFELSFRDERYMPFEGAGAVKSKWRLELPSHFRPFDYQSINDVFLNISYEAEESSTLRQQVESRNATVVGGLLNYLSNNRLTRVFSLRQEFSSAFNRLVESTAGTPATFDITDRHFPLFLQGRALTVASATMVLAVDDRSPVGAVSISVNGTAATGFSNPTNPPSPSDSFGGLPTKALGGAFAAGLKKQHTIVVNGAGNLAPSGGAASPVFDPQKLRDVLLVIEYRL